VEIENNIESGKKTSCVFGSFGIKYKYKIFGG